MKQNMSNMAIKGVIICVISMLVLGGCVQNQMASDESNPTATGVQADTPAKQKKGRRWMYDKTVKQWWKSYYRRKGDFMIDKDDWGKNTVAIDGIVPKKKRVVIPEKIGGQEVKHFSGNDDFCNKVVERIDFPKTVTKIYPGENYYFTETFPNLRSIRFDPKNKVYACKKGLFYKKQSGFLLHCFGNLKLKTLIIPKYIRKIRYYAFREQTNIERVVIKPNVKELGVASFASMSNLKEVTCKGDLKKLWGAEFHDCIRLRKVTLNEGLENIGDSTFENCKRLKEIVIPSTVEKIEWRAFLDCSKLRKVVLPSNIKYIGRVAFSGCESLKRVVIPKGTKLGKDAFPTTCKVIRK